MKQPLHTVRPLIGCTHRRPCEESFALRAWSYAWLRTAPLAEQVETLRHYPGLEPLWRFNAQRALASLCPVALQASATELWRETTRRSQHRPVVYRLLPQLATEVLA